MQLLRNEAASRIAENLVAEVRVAEDGSGACFDEFDNPDGLIRQWISAADLVLVESADLNDVAEQLIGSFTELGWSDRDLGSGSSFTLTILSKAESLAEVQIEASSESDGPVIKITSTGPCVNTDGPESTEVLSLEGR